jgi:hypothetical protein
VAGVLCRIYLPRVIPTTYNIYVLGRGHITVWTLTNSCRLPLYTLQPYRVCAPPRYAPGLCPPIHPDLRWSFRRRHTPAGSRSRHWQQELERHDNVKDRDASEESLTYAFISSSPCLSILPRCRHWPEMLRLVAIGQVECQCVQQKPRIPRISDIEGSQVYFLPQLKALQKVKVRIFVTSRPEIAIRSGFCQMSKDTYRDFALHDQVHISWAFTD